MNLNLKLAIAAVAIFVATVTLVNTQESKAVVDPEEMVPLYRLYDHLSQERMYARDIDEANGIIKSPNMHYVLEKVDGYAYRFEDNSGQRLPVYRLYNPKNHDHFFTTSLVEKTDAVAHHGYIDEGKAFYVHMPLPDAPAPQNFSPLYRLYNARTGDHTYTTSVQEKTFAVQQMGYVEEQFLGYVAVKLPEYNAFYGVVRPAAE